MQGETLMNETHLARMIHDQTKKYGEKTAVRYREGGGWKEIYSSANTLYAGGRRNDAHHEVEKKVRQRKISGYYQQNVS